MNIEIDDSRLKEIFRNNNVGLAYLFGSMARGPSPLSDIDIALMLAPAEKERYKKKLFFTIQLQKLFHCNEVDIVILNEAPPALRFNIIKEGKVIYAADESRRISFEAQTMCDYIDTKPLREEYARRLFKNVKEGISMIDKNIIAARISEIKESAKLLQPLIMIPSEEFASNPDYFLKAERLLEIIIQSIIDIGTHIIAAKSLKKAEDYHQVVDILVTEGVYQQNLSDRLHELIGLGNLLAHEYLEIDRNRLHQEIKAGFNNFETICKSIIQYIEG